MYIIFFLVVCELIFFNIVVHIVIYNHMILIDDQKIVKKLSTSISKETKTAKRLLDEYATAACELSTSEPLQ